MILGPLPITSHDILADYTIQFMISMMSEISSFYAIGCLLLISCCLLMTHSMTFYVIPYLLLYIVETTYSTNNPVCIYDQLLQRSQQQEQEQELLQAPHTNILSSLIAHPSYSFFITTHKPILCEFHTEYSYSLYCLCTIGHSHLSIPIGYEPCSVRTIVIQYHLI